jgi:transcriptional regulator with XRE-family HTH domain
MEKEANEKEVKMTFGQVFKKARKKAEKTLREAAEHVGMTIGNISDVEHSRRKPPREEVLMKLEKFYGVEKNYLVNAAIEEWKMPDEAVSIYSRRPELTMSLLRLSTDFPDKELQKMIEDFGKRRKKQG